VVVYTVTDEVLALRRRQPPDFWQSVTGSLRWDETDPLDAARRELFEETRVLHKEMNGRRWRVKPYHAEPDGETVAAPLGMAAIEKVYRPAASRSASALSVRSQVNSGSSRPKCP